MARPPPTPLLTTVSRLLSIASLLRRTQGEEAVTSLLAELSLSPELLEDEARPLPTASLHRALLSFASQHRPEALLEMAEDVVQPEHLGVFVPLLRSSRSVAEALVQASSPDWETLSVGPDHWHGRLRLAPLSEELSRLVFLSQTAQMAAIPRLFGFSKPRLTLGPGQEVALRWALPRLLPALSVALLASLVVGMLAANQGPRMGVAMGLGFAALSTLAAAGITRERRRLVSIRAQRFRIQTFERGVVLHEGRRGLRLLEGSVIGERYLLRERLGTGASGVILRGLRLEDGRHFALKLLRTAASDDPVLIDRLRREGEALALSRHPNVVSLEEAEWLEGGAPYLVMELLEGESLACRLEREGRLSPEELLPIALDLTEALAAVHAAGVVHRDIKPSNVFLTAMPGGKTQAKLIDFGIAQVEWAETRLTQPGSQLGTPGYMSSEQARGERVDARSDLYALGVLLEECLTGRHPGEPLEPPPRDRPSGIERAAAPIPPAWREIIERATAPLPEDRFPNARAMREAIGRAGAKGFEVAL